jgi:hypothetical protein
MSTREDTCETRIGEHLTGRLDDFRGMLKAAEEAQGADSYEAQDAAEAAMYEYPIHVETHKVVTVLLSTGGPHDQFNITLDENGDATRIEYQFSDWFDGASRFLEGDAFDTAEQFLRTFYEGLE